jgi:hypothetical protein
MADKIQRYLEKPEEFKLIPSTKIPDGAPIGEEN